MNIFIIGGGGREHALAWKLRQSPKLTQLYCAPGNGGTAGIATNLPVKPTDIPALIAAAKEHNIDLTVVGPETPLAEGVVDEFQKAHLPIFGPTRAAAALESSKVFCKRLMLKYGIPTASAEVFDSYEKAHSYIASRKPPMVVKADGLAAGKGVVVARTQEEALEALHDIMVRRVFGTAGNQVLVEECLVGLEASLLAFTDGDTVVPMVPACDYKRVYDGDQGPNTGGMGGYSPPEFLDDAMIKSITEKVMKPTVKAMAKEGRPYQGVLYAGIMLTEQGPQVLEFNCRFGDPETQVMLPRLKTDLLDILLAVTQGRLEEKDVRWSSEAYLGVVMASGSYPGDYKTGYPIEGLDSLDEDVLVFHAGTRRIPGKGSGKTRLVTDGGRVLEVVAPGRTVQEARAKVYQNLPRIRFQGAHYRRDIGARVTK